MTEVVFSADSHIIEPMEAWARVDAKYRDRAPHLEYDLNGKKGQYFVAEGIKPIMIGRFFATGALAKPAEWDEIMLKGLALGPKSVNDSSERLKEQDRDGVSGELLYPTMGMMLFRAPDDELKAACFQSMNTWLAEYTKVSPQRLVGIGAVSLHDIPAAIKEMERARKLGIRGMMVTGNPPKGKNFSDPMYDSFWSAVVDMDIPITMHDLVVRDKAAFIDPLGVMGFFMVPFEVQEALAGLILGGTFDRFPKVRIVSAENDISWMPHFMYRLDHGWEQLGQRYVAQGTQWDLKHLPSHYVKKNIWATFQFEGETNLEYVAKVFGPERVMWGSDYPHPDSTWPNSQTHLKTAMSHLSATDRAKIVAGNVMGLYDIKLPQVAAKPSAGASAQA